MAVAGTAGAWVVLNLALVFAKPGGAASLAVISR